MTPDNHYISLLHGKHIPAEANVRKNRRAVFSVVSVVLIAMYLCGKHISAAVTQQAAIEEAVFSVVSVVLIAMYPCSKHISAAVTQHAAIEEIRIAL
jgi:uncharacterized membrane protein YccF (DUF307 family)